MKWVSATAIHRPLTESEKAKWQCHRQRQAQAVPIVKPLTPSEYALLQVLAQLESEERGYAFMSRKFLAHRLGTTVRTIDRKIGLLEWADLVVVTRSTGGSKTSTNKYQLLVPCVYRHEDKKWMSRHACPRCRKLGQARLEKESYTQGGGFCRPSEKTRGDKNHPLGATETTLRGATETTL